MPQDDIRDLSLRQVHAQDEAVLRGQLVMQQRVFDPAGLRHAQMSRRVPPRPVSSVLEVEHAVVLVRQGGGAARVLCTRLEVRQ